MPDRQEPFSLRNPCVNVDLVQGDCGILFRSNFARHAFAVLISGLALFFYYALRIWVAPLYFLFSFPAVFLVSCLFGFWPGIVSTVLLASGILYFFVPPALSFSLENRAELVRLAIFIIMGAGFSGFNSRLRTALLREEQTQRRLATALMASGMGSWDYDVTTGKLRADAKVFELYGLPFEGGERSPRTFSRRIHPDDRQRLRREIAGFTRSLEGLSTEYRVVLPDGSIRWLIARGRCTATARGRPTRFTGVVWDISPRKQNEERLEEALRVRDEFVSIASHELKTPITALKLQIQMAKRSLQPDEKVSRVLLSSERQVNRLIALVEGLLDVSRIAAGKLDYDWGTVELGSLVEETLERHREELAEARCSPTLEAGSPIYVRGDRFRLEQVVDNLLSNAVKYGAGRPVRIRVTGSDRAGIVEIQDFGMGIPPEKQNKIFDRFERAVGSRNIAGLGLGLYIARQIVEAHHGSIQVESDPGRGSVFKVALPLSDNSPVMGLIT